MFDYKQPFLHAGPKTVISQQLHINPHGTLVMHLSEAWGSKYSFRKVSCVFTEAGEIRSIRELTDNHLDRRREYRDLRTLFYTGNIVPADIKKILFAMNVRYLIPWVKKYCARNVDLFGEMESKGEENIYKGDPTHQMTG